MAGILQVPDAELKEEKMLSVEESGASSRGIASAFRPLIPWAMKSGFALMDQGLISGSNFLISILLARWLMPDQYGAYALAFSIFVLVSLLYQSLLLEPMAVFGGSAYRSSLRAYLKKLLWIHAALASFIFITLGAAALVARIVGQSSGLPGALAGITLAAPCVLFFWLARRSFYLELSPASACLGALVYFSLALVGLYLAERLGILSPFLAFLLIAVSALATGIFQMMRLNAALPPDRNGLQVREIWHRHWTYGRWALASCVAGWIPAYIYYPLLSSFSGMAQSGQLKALMNLVLPLQQTQAALTLLFLPYAARIHGQEGSAGASVVNRRITMFVVVGALAYWATIIPLRTTVFQFLYSGKYMEVAYLVPVVAIGSIFWSAVSGSAIVLRAMESPQSVFIAFFASSALSLIIGIPATRRFGLAGAVWGMNIADAGALLMVVVLLRRKISETVAIPAANYQETI